MELICEIREGDLELETTVASEQLYRIRKASRAIIFNNRNQIALLYVSKNNYHKLPGGGVEAGENIMEALQREAAEEAGVKITVTSEIGIIAEYRNKHNLFQMSSCFLAVVDENLEGPSFTEEELKGGIELKRIDINEALQLLQNDKPNDYMGRFIQKRDLIFLSRAKGIMLKYE